MTAPNDIALLREALKPFTDCVEQIDAAESDEEWAKFRLLIGDYRRAAKALAALAPGQHDGAAGDGNHSELLNSSIPAGMKSWVGGVAEPPDWNGGAVWTNEDGGTLLPADAIDDWGDKYRIRIIAYMPKPAPTEQAGAEGERFRLGDRVKKKSGSAWHGRVVGFYSTDLTPEGYAVESEREPGSVQIYPGKALAAAGDDAVGGGA